MNELTLTNLQKFNPSGENDHRISMKSGVSYPTVIKYMTGQTKEPSLVQVARILDGLGIDWKTVTLGELLETSA